MTTEERALYIYSCLRKAGMTHAGACGMLGNLQGETHDFDPMSCETMYLNRYGLTDAEYVRRADAGEYIINKKDFVHDSAGFGIVQWTWWERKQNLLNYAKSQGKSVGDLDIQIEFLLKEIQEKYASVWKMCTNASKTYKDAVKVCVTDYEKPAKQAEQIEKRTVYAKAFYETFTYEEETKEEENIKGYDRRKVLALAHNEVGYMEKKTESQLDDKTANVGSNNYTKYARDLDAFGDFYNGKKQGYAWCDVFVDWLFVQCFGKEKALELLCQTTYSSGAGCTNSYQYYQRKNQAYKRADTPQVGDQIFFGSGVSNCTHTGIVYKVDDNKVYTIEGNTSGSEGVVPNGGCVCRKSYARNYTGIVGYGRPAYNDSFIGTAIEESEISDEEEKISTEETDENYPELSFGDKSDSVKQAQKLLIAKGFSCGSAGADGDFGQGTLSAVKKFQAAYGLEIDGMIGKKTWEALLGEAKPVEEGKKDNVPAPTPSKTQFDRQLLLDIAAAEVGYKEKKSESQLDDREANAGTANYNKYARDLDAIENYYYHERKQGLNWCDIFCDWCFVQAYGVNDSFTVNCQPQYSYGAGCPQSMAYYKAQGRLDLNPQVGDQFFLSDGMGSTGHTGLVVSVANTSVETIEGNQEISNTVDGVVRKRRMIYEIAGFGHPLYNDGYGTDSYIGKKEEEKSDEKEEVSETEEKEEVLFNPPALKKGDKGKSVKKLQALLVYSGYGIGTSGIDSDFGSSTEAAVKKIQTKLGVAQTGIATQEVWAELIKKEEVN